MIRTLLSGDLRFQWRHGFHGVYAVILVIYLAGIRLIPPEARGFLTTLLVFTDTSVLGFFFVGALVLLEREDGILNVLGVTPVPPAAYVASKLATLTALATVVSVPLLLAGHGAGAQTPGAVLAVVFSSLMYTAIGIVVALGAETLNGYFFRGIAWTVGFALPLLPYLGVARHPLWWVLPTLPALALLDGTLPPGRAVLAATSLAVWAAAAVILASRRLSLHLQARCSPGGRSGRGDAAGGVEGREHPVSRTVQHASRSGTGWTIAVGEIRSVLRDPMLSVAFAAPLLFTPLLRFGVPVLTGVLHRTVGFDLTPMAPLLVAFFLAMTPILIGMVSGFVLLDDADERIMRPVSVTPTNRIGWLVRKLVVASVATVPLAMCVAGGNGISPVPWPRLAWVLPPLAAQTPLVALFLAAVARDKVEGVALAKATGVLALAPLLVWFAPPSVRWFAAPVPSVWISEALLADAATPSSRVAVSVAAAVLTTGVWVWLAGRRFVRRQAPA